MGMRIACNESAINPVADIPGDANHDGMVDVSDLGILAANYGIASGASWTQGDFNGDGAVDVSDLGILAANYGAGTSGVDFDADYAKAFGEPLEDETSEETSDFACPILGMPLVALCLLAGLGMIGLKELKS